MGIQSDDSISSQSFDSKDKISENLHPEPSSDMRGHLPRGRLPRDIGRWLKSLPSDFLDGNMGVVGDLIDVVLKLLIGRQCTIRAVYGRNSKEDQCYMDQVDRFKVFKQGKSDIDDRLSKAARFRSKVVTDLATLTLILYQGNTHPVPCSMC